MITTLIGAWWAWLAGALLAGGASAASAMLSLSATTAYGTEYHNLSQAQRAMARMLSIASLLATVSFGLLGLAMAAWSLRLLLH